MCSSDLLGVVSFVAARLFDASRHDRHNSHTFCMVANDLFCLNGVVPDIVRIASLITESCITYLLSIGLLRYYFIAKRQGFICNIKLDCEMKNIGKMRGGAENKITYFTNA